LKITIIIPVYNEQAHLDLMLGSLIGQTIKPSQVIIVDDNSTDNTPSIIKKYVDNHDWISAINTKKTPIHSPGAKVVEAFYKGYQKCNPDTQLIGKFDADIILPPNYLEKMVAIFTSDPLVGMAAGNLYIKNKQTWVFENISEKTKVRGPIKLYKKECFEAIGGLKKSIGWDTIDVLLAGFHGWKTKTDTSLHVKHLKATGNAYSPKAKYLQGEAFYKMRYSKTLASIAALKLSILKKDPLFYLHCMKGYAVSKKQRQPFMVSYQEGVFIRNLRWKAIKKKIKIL